MAKTLENANQVLNGQDLRAVDRVFDRQGQLLADVGATCERVPVDSLDWLIRYGHVVMVVPVETAVVTEAEAAQ